MAKLHSYYVLCPLIDQKSFLGVSHDKDDETVIVTLGRNVVNKYRLSDQKQTGGWTSKDHITAPVIYDKLNACYVGVFNNNTIKMWKEDSDNLDRVKKYKFPISILKVLPNHIVFANGNCAALTYAIENRKSYDGKASIKDTEEIVAVDNNKKESICFIVKSESNYEIVHCPLRVELGDLDRSKINRVMVKRPEDVYVVGHLIHAAEKDVYILWSDSKLAAYNWSKKTWRTVGTIPWISTTDSVSLMWMSYGHIVAFGSNLERDGAIIVAYNIDLGIGSYRYPMKMYTKNAKLFCFDNRIILEASNHIGILPYVVELKRNLSSLLGSHEIAKDEHMEIADWGSSKTPEFQVSEDIKKLLKQGLSERTICAQVISDTFDSKSTDCETILAVLKQFKDVPESVVLMLINHVMKTVNTEFDITDNIQIGTTISSFVSEFKLLDYLLGITFSDALLIPHLRSGMPLNDALFLMAYISYLLIDTEKDTDVEESRLLDWCALLMDAFYQQYLMTKDDKVTIVLEKMLQVLINLINQLGVVDNTIALMHKVLYTKPSDDNEEVLPYSIELMEL